jgi:phosphoserine phosphatase
LATELGADLRQAAAYGDSAQDLPLLEAVEEPVAVSPDRRLLETALARDWEILASRPAHGIVPR